METFCLLLTGRLAGADPGVTEAMLAAAFGMSADAFRQQVWQRVPLSLRDGLTRETADAQARQLQSLGAEATVMADDGARIWLLRGEHTLGPLPALARPRFARPGDRWCHDGDASWQDLPATGEPPPLPGQSAAVGPLPIARPQPPPLPHTAPAARRGRVSAWLGGLVLVVLLAVVWWRVHAAPPTPSPAAALRYVPRPLQPMAPNEAPTCAAAAGASPRNDEDHFLLAGGARQLTGRSQREGDNYVAEAVVQRDAQCQPSAVQLYVFHRGVLVGTPLESPLDPRRVRLSRFALSADGELTDTLQRCDARAGSCRPETYRARLQPGGGGWVLACAAAGPSDHPSDQQDISERPACAGEMARTRGAGAVPVWVTVGADRVPGTTRRSGQTAA
jgi:hypothetical protein